jgi:mono/diheme cytochrome c family protein
MKTKDAKDVFRVSRSESVGLVLLIAVAAVALLLVSLPVGAQTAAQRAQSEGAAGNAKNGKQLYANHGCIGCHGRTGEGLKFAGPRIGPPRLPLDGFTEYVRRPAGKMPPFSSETLPDPQMADIYAFLKSIPHPPAKGIPASPQTAAKDTTPESASADVQNGKQLYTSSGCYECHGREGQGSRFTGPRLGPPTLSLGGFTGYIRQPSGQMPPYTSKVLSDAEVGNIYAFLKSIPQPPPVKSIPLLN